MNKLWLACSLLITSAMLAGCQGPKEFRSERPFVMRAVYLDNACGPTGPHLKLQEDTLLSATGEEIEYGFEFFTADGVRTPDDPGFSHAVAGNTYELEGYYYYHIEYGRRILHPRLDLVGWRLLAPYQGDENGQGGAESGHFEQYWDLPKKDPVVFQLSRTYKTDCK